MQSEELLMALKIFSRFFDLINLPVAIINTKGEYIYYNQESAQLDGYSVEQALGKPLLEVYPNMHEAQSTMLQSLYHGYEYINQYQVYSNAQGKAVDYQHTTLPLYDANHTLLGVIEIGQDLSNVRKLQQQVVHLNQKLYKKQQEPLPTIITQSSELLLQIEKTQRLAQNDVPVLITGETGTGKEMFAQLLHKQSPRHLAPFIALNCAALPANLIESTLFGTVKGAFTGAIDSPGYLELANNGTLFLDELNAMPITMQSKLLRFLQDKTYWKLGDNHVRSSNIRIVAAMNESPERLIEQGRLRQDLLYRLNIGLIHLPALRDRLDDILPLTQHFIEKYPNISHHKITGISDTAYQALRQHTWPGNIRMLENVIVRSMIMQEHSGELQHIDFGDEIYFEQPQTIPNRQSNATKIVTSPEMTTVSHPINLPHYLAQLERQYIVNALNYYQGSITRTAQALTIPRTALHYKIKKYAITTQAH